MIHSKRWTFGVVGSHLNEPNESVAGGTGTSIVPIKLTGMQAGTILVTDNQCSNPTFTQRSFSIPKVISDISMPVPTLIWNLEPRTDQQGKSSPSACGTVDSQHSITVMPSCFMPVSRP